MLSNGITADLVELIALERHAQSIRYRPHAFASRIGRHVCKIRGRGMDFSEVRHYQAGDEIRHMEWRVTARTGKPHVKVYQEEREQPVVIVVDFNASMYFGTHIAFKSVIAAQLAAILAWTAAKQGDRVGGLLCSPDSHHEWTPRSRDAAVLPFLAGLSLYTHKLHHQKQPNTSTRLDHTLLRLDRVIKPGSIIVLISDFYALNKECEHILSRFASHHDVLAYHICDPLELTPPAPQRYAISNGKEELILDTTRDAIRFGYQFYCDEKIRTLKESFSRLGIQYTQVTAENNLASLVYQTFPWRRHA